MALSYFSFIENEEIFDDKLIKDAIKELEKRYVKMADWIKENKGINNCPKCNSDDLDYKHNGIECNNCNHFKEVKVPYPAQGGVVASRKLESVLKEMFGTRLGRKRKKEKPTKNQLKSLPFKIGRFNTGEYTPTGMKFLKNRYQELINQDDQDLIGADNFLCHIMAEQELMLQKIYRRQALEIGKAKSNTLDKQREFKVYNDIIDNLEYSKKSRKVDKEENALDEIVGNLDNDVGDIGQLISKYEKEKEEDKKVLEESKQKRREAGNPY
jgi:hypothetical protein